MYCVCNIVYSTIHVICFDQVCPSLLAYSFRTVLSQFPILFFLNPQSPFSAAIIYIYVGPFAEPSAASQGTQTGRKLSLLLQPPLDASNSWDIGENVTIFILHGEIFLAWSGIAIIHTITTATSSYVQLLYYTWKIPFQYNHVQPLALVIFLSSII